MKKVFLLNNNLTLKRIIALTIFLASVNFIYPHACITEYDAYAYYRVSSVHCADVKYSGTGNTAAVSTLLIKRLHLPII